MIYEQVINLQDIYNYLQAAAWTALRSQQSPGDALNSYLAGVELIQEFECILWLHISAIFIFPRGRLPFQFEIGAARPVLTTILHPALDLERAYAGVGHGEVALVLGQYLLWSHVQVAQVGVVEGFHLSTYHGKHALAFGLVLLLRFLDHIFNHIASKLGENSLVISEDNGIAIEESQGFHFLGLGQHGEHLVGSGWWAVS
jgi:hypothetical protein